jgi:hypothetical protein
MGQQLVHILLAPFPVEQIEPVFQRRTGAGWFSLRRDFAGQTEDRGTGTPIEKLVQSTGQGAGAGERVCLTVCGTARIGFFIHASHFI